MAEDHVPVDPIEPVDPLEPIDPIDPDEPVDPADPAEIDPVQLQASNKKLFQRAKKAEADLKALKLKGSPANPASPQPDVQEAATIAALEVNGMPDELISELKAVAKVRNISLIKAQSDPIFVAVKEKFEKDKKQKEATLGASRGAGQAKAAKSFNTPNLSRDEHKAMVLGS